MGGRRVEMKRPRVRSWTAESCTCRRGSSSQGWTRWASRLTSRCWWAVRTHIENIFEKLEVTCRVEAVTEGLRKGLIEM